MTKPTRKPKHQDEHTEPEAAPEAPASPDDMMRALGGLIPPGFDFGAIAAQFAAVAPAAAPAPAFDLNRFNRSDFQRFAVQLGEVWAQTPSALGQSFVAAWNAELAPASPEVEALAVFLRPHLIVRHQTGGAVIITPAGPSLAIPRGLLLRAVDVIRDRALMALGLSQAPAQAAKPPQAPAPAAAADAPL